MKALTLRSRVSRAFGRLHSDEAGNETLQTILILAVGAIVLIGLNSLWNSEIKQQFIEKLTAIFSFNFFDQ